MNMCLVRVHMKKDSIPGNLGLLKLMESRVGTSAIQLDSSLCYFLAMLKYCQIFSEAKTAL